MNDCTVCNVFHDAFGETQLDIARRAIWVDWERHIVSYHPGWSQQFAIELVGERADKVVKVHPLSDYVVLENLYVID